MTRLALLAAKPPVSHTGLRPGTFPLVLSRLIPGSRHVPSHPSMPFPLGQMSPIAPKKQVLPARARPIHHRHDAPRRSNPHRARCAVGASTSRDFVPWRFSDASRRRAWMGRRAGVRETCTKPDLCPQRREQLQGILYRELPGLIQASVCGCQLPEASRRLALTSRASMSRLKPRCSSWVSESRERSS